MYPDVYLAGLTPLEHFVKYGAELGYLPSEDYVRHSCGGQGSLQAYLDYLLDEQNENESFAIANGNEKLRLTVICIVYNQAEFIRQTLDSILMQKTDFKYQLLIGDDCSTDGTADIIREYAEKYSNILAVLRTHNVGPNANFSDLARRVESEYVAVCEGDDYWTDENKLRIQVSYLDRNPDFAICFHPVQVLYESDPSIKEIFPIDCPPEVSLHSIAHSNLIQTNSVVYRWRFGGCENFDMPEELAPGDWLIHLLHAEVGRVGFLNKNMAVYRKNAGGIWSTYTSQLARYKIHGSREIRFFARAQALFGGMYHTEYKKAQLHILTTLGEAYIRENRVDLLFSVLSSNPDIANEGLRAIGYPIDFTTVRSAESLEQDMRSMLTVSIVVTTYNHINYIRRCLDSLIAQKGFFTSEIIVGDDCSTDGTIEVIREYADRLPAVVKVVDRRRNVGMLQNMKECIDLCSGNYIAICEGDDYWISESNLTEKLSVLQKDDKLAMCFSWVLLELESQNSFLPHVEQGSLSTGKVTFLSLASAPLTANFSCCVYRNSALKSVPEEYYEGKFSADWLLNLYIADKGDVFFLKKILTVYTVQEKGQWSGLSDSIKHSRIEECIDEFARIFGNKVRSAELVFRQNIKNLLQTVPDKIVQMNFDFPTQGSLRKVGNGVLLIQGWAVLSADYPCFIHVESGSKSEKHSIDQRRPDVINEIISRNPLVRASDKCGFGFEFSFDPYESIFISIEIDGKISRWIEINFELYDGKVL